MKQKRTILGNESGFTLIEMIAVIIVLGILAAVAIPKYMDAQTKARTAAINAALGAAAANVNLTFAHTLLGGCTNDNIVFSAANGWSCTGVNTNIANTPATTVGDFTAGYAPTGCDGTTANNPCTVTVTLSAGPTGWFATDTTDTKTKNVILQ